MDGDATLQRLQELNWITDHLFRVPAEGQAIAACINAALRAASCLARNIEDFSLAVRDANRRANATGRTLDWRVARMRVLREASDDLYFGPPDLFLVIIFDQLRLCVAILAWSKESAQEASAPMLCSNDIGFGLDHDEELRAWNENKQTLWDEYPSLEPIIKELAGSETYVSDEWVHKSFVVVTELAVHLLKKEYDRTVPKLLIAVPHPFMSQDKEDDRTKSESDIKAKLRRQSGLLEPIRRVPFVPSGGIGYDSQLERAINGATVGDRERSLASLFPNIYHRKLRDPVDGYWGGNLASDRPSAPSSQQWGGYDDALTIREGKRAYNAVAFANREGMVLNAGVTISWFAVPGTNVDAQAKFFEAFRKNLSQWLTQQNAAERLRRAIFVYVHENPGGKRFHTHMLLHIAPLLVSAFAGYLPGAVGRAVGEKRISADLLKVVLKHRVRPFDRHAVFSQWRKFHYMMKGADPEVVLCRARSFEYVLGDIMKFRYSDPGRSVVARRVGQSDALAPAARKNFVSQLDTQIQNGNIDVRQLFSDCYLRQWEGKPAFEQCEPISAVQAPNISEMLQASERELRFSTLARVLWGTARGSSQAGSPKRQAKKAGAEPHRNE